MTTAADLPPIGLGTYGRTGPEGRDAILKGIEIGYRLIDTAQSYGNEREVGEAIRAAGIPRGDLFVTTKVADTRLAKGDFLPSVEESLERIGIGPVDLLLIHWPSEGGRVPLEDYVTALAEAQQRGFTRRIGVSNFPIALLDRTEAILGRGALTTDQVELHPYLQAPRLVAHARAIGLRLTAYQPLDKGRVEQDPVLGAIATRHGVTASAVALAFLMAEGHVPIPASSRGANLRANFRALEVRLEADDMTAIRALDRGKRGINPAKAPHWDD
jgi:2,5-diketo-D-gluconate reductase B